MADSNPGETMQSPTQRPWFDRLAHDLRSPLTSLQTAAYLLRSDPGGSNTKELADIVVRQAQRMGKMIEELDDWSRAEQGRLVDATETLDLDGALDMALTSVPGCMLEPTHVGSDANGLVVRADGTRLPQLFRTMLEQVIARDAQSARITIARDGNRAQVTVMDDGPVLAADVRAALLDKPQIPPPDNGLGLRLLIARAIAEGHGGELRIIDDGHASFCLRCTLPLA
jgi:signal transduction histidine kinase